jgi:multiple sugar transport system substrate-binding protein
MPTGQPASSASTGNQVSGIPQAPMPSLSQHTSPPPDADEKHSIGMLIMLGVGLLFSLTIAIVIIWFVFSHIFGGGNKTVSLEYWGLWEDANVMQSVISDFERQNPLIKVHYVKEDAKEYVDRLLAHTQQGDGPDIFRFHNTWVPMILPLLSPLPQDVISGQVFAKTYYPVARQDLVKNGAIYGIPLEIDTLALFTNTQMLAKENVKIPTNWRDFITAAQVLTVKDDKGKIKTAGAAIGTYDNVTHAPDLISLLLVQNGANTADIASTGQNATDALGFYTNFVKGDGNVWDDTLDPSFVAFAKGQVGMYFGYSWDIFNLKAYNPSLEFNVSPVPHLPGRDITIASYWVEGVSVKSKHQKEAMQFMKFLAQKETQQKLFSEEAKVRDFGEPYSRTDLANLVKDNQLLAPFLSQAPQAVSSVFAADTGNTKYSERLNQYLQRSIGDILQDTSPETAVGTLAEGVSQVLSQYAPNPTSSH